jgi:endoglycosylceramidase
MQDGFRGWHSEPVTERGRTKRRRYRFVVALAVLVGAAYVPALHAQGAVAPAGTKPVGTLGHAGRWFTDGSGRVVMLRGFNFVEKFPPYTPAADGFDDDDAALIAANGFNTIRLGVAFEFLMPTPGQIDRAYLGSLAKTVRILGRHHIYVLLDFHQDGWGPVTNGNGMPAWATYTDGLPNPPEVFPRYYVTNPALQRAFENFWANRPGPNDVPLQTYYAQGMTAVAARVVSSPNVIGYEAMNEPWPGADWQPCVKGCPEFEAQLLAPFYARMTAAVRTVDRRHPVFVEPFVLFNFGNAATSLPGAGSTNALSAHAYAVNAPLNALVMDHSVAAAQRDGAPVLVTEWGATVDPAFLTLTEDQFDARLVPWLFWSYNGLVVSDSRQPLVSPNLNTTVLDALTRPYPTHVNGTPIRLGFDSATATLGFAYSTHRPDGRPASRGLETEIAVPARSYPTGYAVTVLGADVTSKPCASTLTLRHRPGAEVVWVRVTRASCPTSTAGRR